MPTQSPSEVFNIKDQVRERDGQKCCRCGLPDETYRAVTGRSLDVHRLVPGSLYTVDGCVTLCGACHKKTPHPEKLSDRDRSVKISGETARQLLFVGASMRCPDHGLAMIIEMLAAVQFQRELEVLRYKRERLKILGKRRAAAAAKFAKTREENRRAKTEGNGLPPG